MVHPRVLEMSGIDPTIYSGFAFGLGQERVAMLRYGIKISGKFYQGEVRFSKEFKIDETRNTVLQFLVTFSLDEKWQRTDSKKKKGIEKVPLSGDLTIRSMLVII